MQIKKYLYLAHLFFSNFQTFYENCVPGQIYPQHSQHFSHLQLPQLCLQMHQELQSNQEDRNRELAHGVVLQQHHTCRPSQTSPPQPQIKVATNFV